VEGGLHFHVWWVVHEGEGTGLACPWMRYQLRKPIIYPADLEGGKYISCNFRASVCAPNSRENSKTGIHLLDDGGSEMHCIQRRMQALLHYRTPRARRLKDCSSLTFITWKG